MYRLNYRRQILKFELVFWRGGKNTAALGLRVAKGKGCLWKKGREGEGVPSPARQSSPWGALKSWMDFTCENVCFKDRFISSLRSPSREDGSIPEITKEQLLVEAMAAAVAQEALAHGENTGHIYFGRGVAQCKLCQPCAAQLTHTVP